MRIGNANIHIQINVSEFIKKLVSFLFCEFNRVTSQKGRQKSYFRTFIISNSQIEILVSFSRSTIVNVNMYFRNSNFEGNFSTYVFGKLFWHYRDLNIVCWTWRHILWEKILNTFVCVELRIIVEKWNVYEGHIFSGPLLLTCRLETTSLCLNYRLPVKKN